ncbi:hypothetical protein CLUG_02764 [Clavispora lusitaniae ATCC 42720]|uniref:Uncharacterized protein n=1 Tax=Clavispora lusitaniae (strain ATCC 42720) TaxID=306902 RepID=C4Y2K1_CLAL4|nr:uncharacterized protein CLUG_02764 [Clavispora lusitaniae ATCC 42720]EEQ38638.1 hypothetical protein CLUG_02764 [Clavispora lusitaniae ATCC 42720]
MGIRTKHPETQNAIEKPMPITSATINLLEPNEPKVELPAVLTIAGSDSSGGAGIEADIKTMTAHSVYGLTCITSLTAQNTLGVSAVVDTPKEHVKAILEKNFEDFLEGYEGAPPLKVVKTGMLTKDAVEVLASYLDYLESKKVKLVVDPVMVSTSGKILTNDETMQLCQKTIIPRAYLCMPNYVEALHLWKCFGDEPIEIETVDQFKTFTVRLQEKLGCANLLVKGGHIPWLNGKKFSGKDGSGQALEIVDVLFQSDEQKVTVVRSSYIESNNSHGTGCTLASSVASNLAKGIPLQLAVPLSVNYIHRGMTSLKQKLGHGKGPLNHTVEAKASVKDVIKGEKITHLVEKHGSIIDYFTNHPRVNENWNKYVHHEFLDLLARNRLPFDRFLFYLKQDFYYLVNYAQVHAIAASVAPTCEQIHAQSLIIGSIIEEIKRHKKKLLTVYNIDYDNADLDEELQPASACIAYCDYLLSLGKTEDFLGLKVALAPCLHGYAEAGIYGKKIREKVDPKDLGVVNATQSETYGEWLNDYVSDWYTTAEKEGRMTLDDIFQKSEISEERLEELVTIFNTATILEIGFWDYVTRDI